MCCSSNLCAAAFCAAAVVLAISSCSTVRTPEIVPLPERTEFSEGRFMLLPDARVYVYPDSREMRYAADELGGLLSRVFGAESCPEFVFCGNAGDAVSASMVMTLSENLGPSSYMLDISGDAVSISGGDASGVFYAVQTLRQLIPAGFSLEAGDGIPLPAVKICDSPAFEYRGVMLDVARHFFSVDEVKTLLDIMAIHKMNVFHWHLTDDQGWRIAIDSWPELVKTGSIRKRTIIGKDPGGEYDETTQYDETPHSGYYTKDEIRDIVAYAAGKFISVIPEIEFPGHAVAAIASYPWLGCTGEQFEVRQTWDIDDRVFCIGRESTFRFFEDVLREVAELFPSGYIHIGGDECPSKMWEKCPECRRRMEELGLESFRQLQGYGTGRLEKFLGTLGCSIIGWDEILEAGVSSSAIVMSWRGCDTGAEAARRGNRVIMSPTEYSYFDYYQSVDTEAEPLAWGGYLPLEKVYSFNPCRGLDENEKSLVLGVQANLWTEYIPDFRQAEYMLLPRLAAMSEVAWHGCCEKDWPDFRRRLETLLGIYRSYGYAFKAP
ncbi:MAG: beta-N-acetylhexosaminidase [Bacteroides sp.]|nr:beta-N-acetylhexosaminidase [Bacteroides sp.]